MKQEEWIKVTDKMPELIDHCAYTVFVLVCYKEQYEYLGMDVRYTKVACYDYKEKGWFDHNEQEVEGVTHWMPIILPKED